MLKFLVSLIVLLNPVVGFFAASSWGSAPINAVSRQTPASDSMEYRLPLTGDLQNFLLAAQLLPPYPLRNWQIMEPEISAQTALVILSNDHRQILWQKNDINQSRSIASLTKLMTALVTIDNAQPDDVFFVSREAVATSGEMGNLIVGEKLTVKSLLEAMLIESSNDAAVALAENIQDKTSRRFMDLMNERAKELELSQTYFADPSGLDPANRASAWDLTRILQETIKHPLLTEIMRMATAEASSTDGKFTHHWQSTDKLLDKLPNIIAGKTGYTEEAGACMILAVSAPDNNHDQIITVVFDSADRLQDTETLINWTPKAFLW